MSQPAAKRSCARCGKKTTDTAAGELVLDGGRFRVVQCAADRRGDVFVFGGDCLRRILRNGGKKDWAV